LSFDFVSLAGAAPPFGAHRTATSVEGRRRTGEARTRAGEQT
jgi:hypothetical protein